MMETCLQQLIMEIDGAAVDDELWAAIDEMGMGLRQLCRKLLPCFTIQPPAPLQRGCCLLSAAAIPSPFLSFSLTVDAMRWMAV